MPKRVLFDKLIDAFRETMHMDALDARVHVDKCLEAKTKKHRGTKESGSANLEINVHRRNVIERGWYR